MRTYEELLTYHTYEDRLNYLMLRGNPGEETFGGLRELNQQFYTSPTWRNLRVRVITRDCGLDLGLPEYEIIGRVFVHHMNPVDPHILVHKTHLVLDPRYLITVSFDTHQSIHYGREMLSKHVERVRYPGDTKLW